jgi:predicted metal-dependent RNase
MTSVQLNAEILRNMSIIAEDENLLKRAAKYLRKLVAEKEDPTHMTKEEFFARVDKAEKEIAEGKGITFTNKDDMNAWLNSL